MRGYNAIELNKIESIKIDCVKNSAHFLHSHIVESNKRHVENAKRSYLFWFVGSLDDVDSSISAGPYTRLAFRSKRLIAKVHA